jgi:hypothetical protein
MEKSSIKLVAGALALLLLVPAFAGTNMQVADAATLAGIIVPLYTYPGAMWDTVIEAKNDHTDVPIVAIVNPASGPGGSKDSNYVSGINKLKDAGVIVIGYVSTSYASRSLTAVEGDIDKWDSWYNVEGIFFDEQTNWAGKESYYTQAGDYAESKGLDFTVGNPGANSIPSYLSTVDVVLIYESPSLPDLDNYDQWDSYDNSQLGMIPYGVKSLPTSWIQDAIKGLGWIYVTGDVLPNPWDSLPSYFGDMVALLDDGSSGGGQDPQYGMTIKSVDQNGKAIIGMWMEVKKDGSTIKTGFTPLSLTMGEGAYTVSAGNYQQTIFDHWSDGSKSSTASVSLYGDTQLTAYYNNGATQPTTVTLTVNAADSGGKAITGYYTTLSQNGDTVKTAFSPASFTLNSGQGYQVSVSDYGGYAFDHWNDGSISRQKTVTLQQSAILTAYYKTAAPEEAVLIVKSVDLSGKTLTGLWTVVKKDGAIVKTGYTPLTYTAQAGSTYEVSVSNYMSYAFDHWESGSRSSTTLVTVSADTTMTAYYSTEPTKVTLSVKSVGLNGSPITGLWTVVSGEGSTTGFTPLSYTANSGSEYMITMGEWQNYKFDHWDNGSTSKTRTITPNGNTVLTVYYRQ